MAKFVRRTSDVALALDRIQSFAENLISYETRRRIQLGREKESRVVDAYSHMLREEDNQINELETALDAVETNFINRGVELKSVKDEHRTIASEELLNAANEGAIEMMNVRLNDSKDYKSRLENKKREASKILRHIELFDDAVSLVEPGEDKIIDAKDVADVAEKFIDSTADVWEWSDRGDPIVTEKYKEEVDQRLKELQTESSLQRLQEDYYARLARESKEKVTAASAEYMDADIKIKTLEPVKQEAQEAVKAITYQPVSKMVEVYGVIISRQAEIDALATDDTSDQRELWQEEITAEEKRLGAILYPWAYSPEQMQILAQGMQTALTKVIKSGDYYDLINYFRQGNAQYKLMVEQGNPEAEIYRADIKSMLGVDIASDDWISQLIEFNEISGRIDIEQATESIKISKSLLPEEKDDGEKNSLKEKYGFE